MISERLLTGVVKAVAKRRLDLKPTSETTLPAPEPGRTYMLYLHVPFCQVLCPYCSFNRYPFREDAARPYFANMRREMLMLKDLGYDFESLYIGGGTPTILIDELCATIDLARENFSVVEVSSETNPNHLTRPYLEMLKGRVQRLSVGVQSFDDGLLKQMDRYRKYGSGEEILERIAEANGYVDSLNVDMIFNFPSQTEEILCADLEKIAACGARQVTFSPLYASRATVKNMEATLGKLDYDRERRFYHLLDGFLAEGPHPRFRRTTLWTFTRSGAAEKTAEGYDQIDEYQTNYDDYPAIGSGSITHLRGALYVNTFGIADYNAAIDGGRMSVMGKSVLSKHDLMDYRFLVELYKLRLDKRRFERDFGCSVERGLPLEMAFMRANGAFERDDADELTLTAKGRYLVSVMYREFLSGMNNLRDQARAALSGAERTLLFEEHGASAADGRCGEGAPCKVAPQRPSARNPHGGCGRLPS